MDDVSARDVPTEHFAQYSAVTQQWVVPFEGLFDQDVEFAGKWPRSGAVRDGLAFSYPEELAFSEENGLSCVCFLPTPTVVDMGNNKTIEEWEDWTRRMKQRHGNGNGHGPSLNIEALRMAAGRTQ